MPTVARPNGPPPRSCRPPPDVALVGSLDRTVREPGEPGVRLRCYLDLKQPPVGDPATGHNVHCSPAGTAVAVLTPHPSDRPAPCPQQRPRHGAVT
ncbi:DUF6207 family protein [Streptomyces sp. enrichment culture]|uniref:DUF6207 family protein n=1 Tax=Streptomyces sp. enrichment culture TaxID=1795815 RepID=UPI003F563D7A